ncbi:tetratricopeptide repeat protein [Pseudoalteromonas sp. MMG013]|uniref:Ancillary SecYEG translocon subunit n=1 Tax=Pseudoalteromonas aurantia 208 TaxID=1314867 RepID=A0ABR9E5Q4_9GAMM|nr:MULTISPECIES: tetratricopeptide repeat protein [Pseudoalteromonas]MBE0366330.1 hypothetical protein [Pseudoalteromonas aurantia 208]MBQ4846438.1 tetratricopeptide repeat protein [Pseudoalteromonas sp. MMG005]MBQ4862283.1 tetratricopeptide repeat protein [Pseudoalteromonas sp. MMG013]
MEIYSTDEQQAEAIKQFFRDNGVSLALGIVIGLGGLYGWKAYNQNQISNAEAASSAYSSIAESGEILASADSFIKDNAESNYAVLAAFVAAKEAVDSNQYGVAAEKLRFAADSVKNPELKATALTRLARVQLADKKLDDALATLEAVMPTSFNAQVSEIRGDVYLEKGDKQSARTHYQAAVSASEDGNNTLLQNKLDDLAIAQTAV